MKRADFERLLGPYEELWRYEALRKVSQAPGLGSEDQLALSHDWLSHV